MRAQAAAWDASPAASPGASPARGAGTPKAAAGVRSPANEKRFNELLGQIPAPSGGVINKKARNLTPGKRNDLKV